MREDVGCQLTVRPPPRLGPTAVTVAAAATAAATAMAQYKGAASEAGRAMHLMKKREKQREQMEQMKQRIAEVGPSSLEHARRAVSAVSPGFGLGVPRAEAGTLALWRWSHL